MSTEDFIAACLMVPTKLIDDLCDEYDVDFSDDVIFDLLDECAGDCFHKSHYRKFGDMLVGYVLNEIIDKYIDTLDGDKFECDINGADSAIIYDGEVIESKQQLDDIYNKALKCAQSDNN